MAEPWPRKEREETQVGEELERRDHRPWPVNGTGQHAARPSGAKRSDASTRGDGGQAIRRSLIALAYRVGSTLLDQAPTTGEPAPTGNPPPVGWAETDGPTEAAAAPTLTADRLRERAREVLCTAVERLDADLPVVSDASPAPTYDERRTWNRYLLVEPLHLPTGSDASDAEQMREATVNIALVEGGRLQAGVVHAPLVDLTYLGQRGGTALRYDAAGQIRRLSGAPAGESTRIGLALPRSASGDGLDAFQETFLENGSEFWRVETAGPLAMCRVAEGSADLHPQPEPTPVRQAAAGVAVVRAAGGEVRTFSGEPIEVHGCQLSVDAHVAAGDASWFGGHEPAQ